MQRFVVIHPGARDSYQVAIALQEAGALVALITDFHLAGKRGGRGLSVDKQEIARHTRRSVLASLASFPKRLNLCGQSTLPWDLQNSILGIQGGFTAVRKDAGVLAYSGAARTGFAADTARRVLFQFHPTPAHEAIIMKQDNEVASEIWGKVALTKTTPPPRSDRRTNWELFHADQILVASSFTAQGIVSAGISPTRIAVCPYGAPVVHRSIQRLAGPRRFLFVGQAIRRKGLHYLLEAWKRLAVPPTVATLDLVLSSIDDQLMAMTSPIGVRIHRRLPRAELDSLMEMCHVLVLPSLVEGFGLVITEALSRGLHVITTGNTGAPDLNAGKGAVSIVPPMDIGALERGITELIEFPPDSFESYAAAADRPWSVFRHEIRESLTGVSHQP